MHLKDYFKLYHCKCFFERPLTRYRRQLLFSLKVLTLLTLPLCIQANSPAFSQQINLTERNSTLRDVLMKIERQSGYQVLFTSEVLRGTKPVNITLKDNSLKQALDQLMENQPVDFELMQKNILIKKKVITLKIKPGITDTVRKGVVSLQGKVIDVTTRAPLSGATVNIVELGLNTMTNKDGFYIFKELPTGTFSINVNHVGILSQERAVNINKQHTTVENFYLIPNTINLKDVVVVAKAGKLGATSSLISKTAIEHIQATSLGDVLQLLPGGTTVNPSFNNVNKASLRQFAADNTGSFGTSIVMNGAPISNNANLQALNPSTAGVGASFSTSSGAGVDLRQISADNIESVEVIRGIPSVEYGDLTSGAILVKTKAGKEPLQLKVRVNPKISQAWIGEGFDIGKKSGSIFVDMDYTRSVDDQRSEYAGFERVTGNVQYTKTFFKKQPLYSNSFFSYSTNLDESRLDPDDAKLQLIRIGKDKSFRFNTTGKWNLQHKLAQSLNYVFSVNYAIQKGFQQELLSSYTYPLSYATENTTQPGQYVPSEYLSKVWIDGKPLNLFAKITDNFFVKIGKVNHRFLLGTEWRTDANSGDGKTYDLNLPPRMQGGNAARPRAYNDIPALNQFSLYAEDNIFAKIANRNFYLQLGLRYDNMQPFGGANSIEGGVLAPRINLSYELLKNFSLRAGYGVTAKSPSLLYLYPQNAYYDLVNFNYYPENPSERMVLITTKVFNIENHDLKIATNTKKEVGFDWIFSQKRRLTVSAFHEKTKNAYEFDVTQGSIKVVPVDIYTAQSKPVNAPPVLNPIPIRTDLFIADYMAPTNSRLNVNRGVEFDLDMGRFDDIRTSFTFNGALINSRSTSTDYYYLKQQVSGKDPSKIGVFDKGIGTESQRISTTLRIVHNIPEMRFVVTFSAQTIWSDWNKYLNDQSIPLGYIPVTSTGINTVWMNETERSAITSADKELYLHIAPERYITEKWKPLWLYNLRLTKEIGKSMGFSFFANNVFMHQPLERSTRYPSRSERRNPDLFFGTELSIKF